jgi:hypothetical protein
MLSSAGRASARKCMMLFCVNLKEIWCIYMEKTGLDELKNRLMEGVPLDEVSKKDIKWCAAKWYLIVGDTYAGAFADEVFEDQECFYGMCLIALQNRIMALGGKVVPMESLELPEG